MSYKIHVVFYCLPVNRKAKQLELLFVGIKVKVAPVNSLSLSIFYYNVIVSLYMHVIYVFSICFYDHIHI